MESCTFISHVQLRLHYIEQQWSKNEATLKLQSNYNNLSGQSVNCVKGQLLLLLLYHFTCLALCLLFLLLFPFLSSHIFIYFIYYRSRLSLLVFLVDWFQLNLIALHYMLIVVIQIWYVSWLWHAIKWYDIDTYLVRLCLSFSLNR